GAARRGGGLMGRYEELLQARRQQLMADEVSDAPLFGDQFPRAPGVRDEQRGLGLEGSSEALYRAWRSTPESDDMLILLRRIALDWLAQGATTIGPRSLWEAARHEIRRSHDNRLQALACREVEDTTPALRGRFRHRMRKAG
ncbi:MAG TPA: hypothetical protein VFI39_06685, partial [Gemmatimonadales bacterium]|nr:hypothetical protein [Gemmatimonadales bacterium]